MEQSQQRKTHLSKRLAAYSAAAAVAAVAGSAYAADQVVPINTTITYDASGTQFIPIDFDGDADPEFVIATGTVAPAFAIIANTTGSDIGLGVIGTVGTTNYNLAQALAGPTSSLDPTPACSTAALISSGGAFVSASKLFGAVLGTAAGLGNFDGAGVQHLGLAFQLDGNQHGGWVRLSVNAGATQINVSTGFYDDVPNTALRAGCDTPSPTAISLSSVESEADASTNQWAIGASILAALTGATLWWRRRIKRVFSADTPA